jgi:hypothetical protein
MHPPAINKFTGRTRDSVLYNACGRAIGQGFGISEVSWLILRQWQDRSNNRNSGREGGGEMGSKSGRAHPLGCPEWPPPGARLREGVADLNVFAGFCRYHIGIM